MRLNLTKLVAVVLLSLAPVLEAKAASRMSATFYSNYYQGRRMANGQPFRQNSNTVATNRYKLGTRLRICTGKRCVVGVVRDRCNCSIDLSKGLFKQLAPLKKGRVSVKVNKI